MGRLTLSLDLKHDVNLFGKTKVLEWPLSRKKDFSLFGWLRSL